MDGIVFFATERHDEVVAFYRDLGATVWREQPDCTILQASDFRVGFCARDHADTGGIVTFVFDDRAGVDAAAEALGDRVNEPPQFNEKYGIYRAFATDPEDRTVEFQTFE